jgi:anti-anti-sigma factor
MHIDEWWFGDAVVLDLKGQMTVSDSDQLLKNKVKSLVNQGQKNIVLNLAAVPYIDSAGLGEIVRIHLTVSRQGGSLTLQNPTKRITELLSMTRLMSIFKIDGQGADD